MLSVNNNLNTYGQILTIKTKYSIVYKTGLMTRFKFIIKYIVKTLALSMESVSKRQSKIHIAKI